MKLFTDLTETKEFLKYYKGSSRKELKNRLKNIQNKNYRTAKNECRAIIALLA